MPFGFCVLENAVLFSKLNRVHEKIRSDLEDAIHLSVTYFISQSLHVYVHIPKAEVHAQSSWELMGLERERGFEKRVKGSHSDRVSKLDLANF